MEFPAYPVAAGSKHVVYVELKGQFVTTILLTARSSDLGNNTRGDLVFPDALADETMHKSDQIAQELSPDLVGNGLRCGLKTFDR